MRQTIQQAYRHLVQQQIVRQVMAAQNVRGEDKDPGGKDTRGWEAGGIFALFSAAAVCGVLAQVHLG